MFKKSKLNKQLKQKSICQVGSFLIFGLLINEGIFGLIAKNQTHVAGLALQGMLQHETLLSNPYLLSQTLNDLEGLGVIQCALLHPAGQSESAYFLDSRGSKGCSNSISMIYSPIAHHTISAGNGDKWVIEYRASLGTGFFFGLWLTRTLISALIILLWGWFNTKRKILDLERAHAEKMEGAFHDLKSPIGALGNKISSLDPKAVGQEIIDRMMADLIRMRASLFAQFVNEPNEEEANHKWLKVLKNFSFPPFTKGRFFNSNFYKDTMGSEGRSAASLGGTLVVLEENLACLAKETSVFLDLVIPKWAFRIFVPFLANDLHRILMNLCENAIYEAKQREPRVVVSVQRSNIGIQIGVRDFGSGFSQQALTAFEQDKVYSNKLDGHGQGLRSVRTLLRSADGCLKIVSSDKTGSLLAVELPVCEKFPDWFFDAQSADLNEILLLDDDADVGEKLGVALPQAQVKSFSDEEAFLRAARAQPGAFLFVDYNYAGKRNGLSLIRAEGLSERSVLFSGQAHFDSNLQKQALYAGVKIVPKECIISSKRAHTGGVGLSLQVSG